MFKCQVLLMMEEIFDVSGNFTDGRRDLPPFYQGNTCFLSVQAVKKKMAKINPE